jgi:hypothetical protein
MKHILNNLSDEEKNSIREQHTGGMNVVTESFSRLLNSKLGDSKPLVSEQNNLEDIVSARTNFIMGLRNDGYRLTKPGETGGESSAFRPKKKDLMVSGYEGKPLVFTNGYNIVGLEKDGVTVRVFSGGGIGNSGKSSYFKLPKDLDKLLKQL